MPPIERIPAPGVTVSYWPSPRAPQGPTGGLHVKDANQPMLATVAHVHTARLVDLDVTDHAGEVHRVAFVAMLHPGGPDPQSPCGRCEWPDPARPPLVGFTDAAPPAEDEVDIDPDNPDGGAA